MNVILVNLKFLERLMKNWIERYSQDIKAFVLALLLISIPSVASAGWLDWIAPATKAVADATTYVILINAVEKNLVLLSWIVFAILATVQLLSAYKVTENFAISFKAAVRDDKITWPELVFLGMYSIMGLIVIMGLVGFAYFLGWTVLQGISEIQTLQTAAEGGWHLAK